ncbi:YqjF family protein [Tenacibaculum sp. M341]|uniref:YqjF family protein n=1 Tax=Tenacibaculum sp. M341 TaxID=2530339 RepID=UPI0010481218|nr:DUF2071 domain-containing protein [Tenacibaculum sp. M341]TCI85185.1 DUF2071 domain-containing protein [Tenacibaculum sp. M341]
MSFLKAEWRKLVMVNYAVKPVVLQPYVPKGTELDFFEDVCYVSVVGFMFKNTKLLGVKIPFHINFEEVNLRFYVKRKTASEVKRGVVFIKEIVPKPAITFVANTVYNENYETLPMQHLWKEKENELEVVYKWKKNNNWNSIEVIAENIPTNIEENSVIEFISEHYWGYAKESEKKTTEYEVRHPRWQYYPINNFNMKIDFKETYGDNFEFLNSIEPSSVMLLEGAEISVEGKSNL